MNQVQWFPPSPTNPLPPDGSVTATFPRAATASPATRPPMSLGEAFYGPFSLSRAGSCWKSSEWKRTSWCLRRGPSSSLTFPSKAQSGLLGFCPKFTSSLLSPFFQEGFLDCSLLSLHGPSGIWVSTWQTCPWPRSNLLVFAFARTSLGMAGTWPELTLPPPTPLVDVTNCFPWEPGHSLRILPTTALQETRVYA